MSAFAAPACTALDIIRAAEKTAVLTKAEIFILGFP
jgi:hypothetical protein